MILVGACRTEAVNTMEWVNEVDTDGTASIDFLEFGRMMQPEKPILDVSKAVLTRSSGGAK